MKKITLEKLLLICSLNITYNNLIAAKEKIKNHKYNFFSIKSINIPLHKLQMSLMYKPESIKINKEKYINISDVLIFINKNLCIEKNNKTTEQIKKLSVAKKQLINEMELQKILFYYIPLPYEKKTLLTDEALHVTHEALIEFVANNKGAIPTYLMKNTGGVSSEPINNNNEYNNNKISFNSVALLLNFETNNADNTTWIKQNIFCLRYNNVSLNINNQVQKKQWNLNINKEEVQKIEEFTIKDSSLIAILKLNNIRILPFSQPNKNEIQYITRTNLIRFLNYIEYDQLDILLELGLIYEPTIHEWYILLLKQTPTTICKINYLP